MDQDPRHPTPGREPARQRGRSRSPHSRGTGERTDARRSDDRRPSSADSSRDSTELFVPSLLAGLDADDREIRESAADSLCLLACETPSRGASLARELVDGLAGADGRRERLRILAAIADEGEAAVERAVVEAVGRDRGRRVIAAIRAADPWVVPEDASLPYPAGVARTHATAFRQVVTVEENADGEREGQAHTLAERPRRGSSADGDVHSPDPPNVPSRSSGHGSGAEAGQGNEPEDDGGSEAIGRVATSRTFCAIRERSVFEDLSVQSTPRQGRYARNLRTRAERNGEERGVSLRLVPTPTDDPGFAANLAEGLQAWAGLADVDGVVTVHDVGESPRPWLATAIHESTLAERDRLSVDRALAFACRLSGALVQLHERGVVHGGIDPGNVAVAVDHFGGDDRPLLDNVGLVPAFRPYVDLGDVLDLRYAAPELVDRRYGDLDEASDVYGLGAVVYRLCTGRDPYDEAHKPVEERVVRDRLTPPSQVREALPDRLDQVVARATSTQKLTRYESASEFHADLRQVAARVLD